MVVHAITSRMPLGKGTRPFAPFLLRQHPHIAPVVITEQKNYIVGHVHALLVVFLHFLVECPHLRRLFGWFACCLLNDLTLVGYDALQQFHIGMVAHGFISISTHANGYHVLSVFHTLHSALPELIECLPVGVEIPCSMRLVTSPFLMRLGHRLMV